MTNFSKKWLVISLLSTFLAACGSSSSDTVTDSANSTTTNSGTDTSASTDNGTDNSGSTDSGESSDSGNTSTSSTAAQWVMNTTGERSEHILEDGTGLGVLVNVQSVADETINNAQFTKVNASGIPDYDVLATAELISELNSRPRASGDFNGGATSISEGEIIAFGQDIGFASNNSCETNAGYGYWPPGPECPGDISREAYIPQAPETTDEACDTGLGVIGLWVNGTSVYNWGDGQSYNNGGTWYNLAPIAEQYDVDVCGGHAANSDYHHHFYSSCLADMVGDDGSAHSPIYGFAADGYAIYGPWMAEAELAVSAWVTRDYSADSATGCGVDGERSCTLVDPYDVDLGVQSSGVGPGVDAVVSTLSGNQLQATSGYYHEDYYWDADLTAFGGVYLDQYTATSMTIWAITITLPLHQRTVS